MTTKTDEKTESESKQTKIKNRKVLGINAAANKKKVAKKTEPLSTKLSIDDEYDEAGFFDDDEPPKPSHQDGADPLVMPNLVSNRPGPLRTKGKITLHTRSAHRLFYGRMRDEKKNVQAITGLVRFALNMNQLSDLAAKDDPYADAVLLKVEAKLSVTKKYVNECIIELEQLLDDTEDISIDFHQSVRPIDVPLEFRTTYGFVAARLIAKYDKLVRLALTAKHIGMIFSEDWGRFNGRAGRMIRDAFHASSVYRYTGVTRDAIAANNPVARAAIDKYGDLPQSILDGSKRGKYAPDIKKPEYKQILSAGAKS